MKNAFTLIELLITIAIIGILTAIASVSYSGIQARGRDAQRQNDLANIKLALSSYYNAQVPPQYVNANNSQNACTATGTPKCDAAIINNSNDVLTTALKPNFIKNLPLDPLNATPNVYKYQSDNVVGGITKDFVLYATLENKNNKKGWGGGTQWVADGFTVASE